ncbi:hypothetical protein ES288_A12G172900v1 [Gossypium darwinii]|uniref:Uncharacterized protein n=1 Tax=Gossypium darwinii TaxID=34276 RepID=A0A5D2EAP0_GOSDA|nr:hypothetical protein ES288_A12G172900v1 [Gossypium darwinii]
MESQANKYTQENLMLMKTQDIGYILLQKLQSERKKIEKITAVLHSVDNHPSNRHIYYVEDRFNFLISVYHPFSYSLSLVVS